MHYNFSRIHQTLRVTPAMEAGVSDHVWSIRGDHRPIVLKKVAYTITCVYAQSDSATQEKENQKTDQNPRPETPQRCQGGYAPGSLP